jgi:hypothetical protein
MATLVNQEISYESAQVPVAFATMTPDSVRTVFTSATRPWSGTVVTPGVEPYVVAPYGLITGGEVTPGAVAGNVAVATATAMMPGVVGHDANTGVVSVNANTALVITLNNSAEGTPYRIDSVTVNSSGAYALEAGRPHSAFSEVRGALGGPPTIALGSIEIAQIRRNFYHATVNQAVTAAEIFQVPGTHQERYDFPVWSQDPIRGQITFAAALPLIHGADPELGATAGKLVYARYATPLYAPVARCRNWVPAGRAPSVSSEDYYDNVTEGSVSFSLNAATFEASLSGGLAATDPLVAMEGKVLLFRFKPDKNRAPYQITQGILGVARTFGVGESAKGSFTIAANQPSVDFAS